MKRFWKFAGIATLVAILGVAAVGAVAYAQDDGSGGPFDFGGRFREAVANILGVTVDEYDAAVEQAQDQVVDEALEEGWLTEDQAERMRERMDEGLGPRGMDKGFMGLREGFMGRGGDSLLGMIAEELDMSVRDLVAELEDGDGKTLAEVASENGVDAEAIAENYLAQLEEDLTQAVADGKITQNQADWMLQQATESVPDQLNSTWEDCGPHGFPGGGRPGRMGGFPGQSDA
jgi:polyhydroxyalkanoate synthesis regulator phasin